MNKLSTIAIAVTDLLSDAVLPLAFTVKRVFAVPQYNTAERNDLQILVIAFDEDVAMHGPDGCRGESTHDYGAKIAITKRVQADDVNSEEGLAELDALSDFREAVIDFLKTPANLEIGDARLEVIRNSPAAYDPQKLDSEKVFFSLITATYRMFR